MINIKYELYTDNIRYVFDKPKYKFTVIQGNSATGKTKFSELVSLYYSNTIFNQEEKDIVYTGDINIVPFGQFLINPANFEKTIVVIDEDELNINLSKWNASKTLNESNNYFIIITRDIELDGNNNNKPLSSRFSFLSVHDFAVYSKLSMK